VLFRSIRKYAPYKLLNITFNNEGIKREQVEAYGEIHSFDPFSVTLQVHREEVKNVASKVLTSNLPVDDIIIDEVEADDVIRKIFQENKTRNS